MHELGSIDSGSQNYLSSNQFKAGIADLPLPTKIPADVQLHLVAAIHTNWLKDADIAEFYRYLPDGLLELLGECLPGCHQEAGQLQQSQYCVSNVH